MCCEAISALGVGCSGEGGGVVGREGSRFYEARHDARTSSVEDAREMKL